MASKADTWMPLYIADYLRKTMHLNRDQHGGYLLLLMACWDRGGRLPNDAGQLAGIVRASPAEWKKLAPVLLPFFEIEGEFLVQRRVIEEHEKAARLSEARRTAGKQGGRPRKQIESEEKPIGLQNGSQNETHAGVRSSPSQPVEPIGSDTGREDSKKSSLSGGTPPRPSRRSPEVPIPEGYPDVEAVAEAEGWISTAGVALDAASHAKRFRNHAETKDRRERNWPAAWRAWIDIEIEKAPEAPPKSAPAAKVEPFPGPPEVRAAVVAEQGEDWTRAYLDRCGWRDLPDKAITSPNAYLLDSLKRDCGHIFAEMEIGFHTTERSAA